MWQKAVSARTVLITNPEFNEVRDDRVAVESAGPYGNYLH